MTQKDFMSLVEITQNGKPREAALSCSIFLVKHWIYYEDTITETAKMAVIDKFGNSAVLCVHNLSEIAFSVLIYFQKI
jgi:hypothetical protein